MSILSDISIEELCVPPAHVWVIPKDPNVNNTLPHGGLTTTLIHYDPRPFKRDATDEEIRSFVPMITPFKPEQIRHACALDIYNNVLDEGPMPEDLRIHMYVPERKIISKGLTSYGYDVALAATGVKVFTNINSTEIDPKRFNIEKCLVDAVVRVEPRDGSKYVLLPPHSYMLGHTVEYFRMPRDVVAICLGKSTYARVGVIVNVTPIEPGFEGNVVIEISNNTPLPVRIYLEEGISQFMFFKGDQPCRTSYGDRGGKYQGQTGVTHAKV